MQRARERASKVICMGYGTRRYGKDGYELACHERVDIMSIYLLDNDNV
jgi:hypothetical protein